MRGEVCPEVSVEGQEGLAFLKYEHAGSCLIHMTQVF